MESGINAALTVGSEMKNCRWYDVSPVQSVIGMLYANSGTGLMRWNMPLWYSRLQEAQNRPYPDEINLPLRPQHTGQYPVCPNAETNGNRGGI